MERLTPPPSIAETVAVNAAAASGNSSLASITSSASAIEDEGRFAPGALLGGRYRIIGLLGKGGMGEVYRATDLMLQQPVALKFLPEEAAANPRLLERFHGEVRVARLVSHPNVCRVFDIGQVEGLPFISMEYVDGEDLASLLKRIGRLPADKAVEIGRKLCAGIAAAHDRGVIHRDLKPQNIMINKRGDVVIMDFGLAAIADQLSGNEVRNGTPAYMAPEQLRGVGVTARSDIYSLGLVLYELFTGKRPYEAKSLQHLLDLQESANLACMSSVASDIDPAVEKAIRRCLDPDPLKRPASAVAVSASLPGGDALAAALAAGETPSPEMVASHGHSEGMALKFSVACLGIVAASLIAVPHLWHRTRSAFRVSPDAAPEVLAHKSRELAAVFGYPRKPADSAIRLQHRRELVFYLRERKLSPKPWDQWLEAESPINAVYRESPQTLYAPPFARVDSNNPAPVLPGMAEVTLDGNGKLLAFFAKPYDPAPPASLSVPPETVFRAAGLNLATFAEVAPPSVPYYATDLVRAWKGAHPKIPGIDLILEIGWWKGAVTYARVIYPFDLNPAMSGGVSWIERLSGFIVWTGLGLGLVFATLLARRNWKLGRVDRRGALRLGIARSLLALVAWIGLAHTIPADRLIDTLAASFADCLFSGALIWFLYLALEPAVRARWPHSIVTWNRLLGGRWLDSQVSAHVLIGAAVGCSMWLGVTIVGYFIEKDSLNTAGGLAFAMGTRQWIGGHAGALGSALRGSLMAYFGIFGLRVAVRKDWIAAVLGAVLFTFTEGDVVYSREWMLTAAIVLALYAALIFVLLRFGLVSMISGVYFLNSFNAVTMGTDWRAWYVPYGVASMLLMAAIALFAFWRSLGDRELLGSGDAVA